MTPIIIRLVLVITSWASLLLLPRRSFAKFLPVTLFTSLLVLFLSALSLRYHFWVVKGGLKGKLATDLSFIFGPFFAGSLWVFHFTFGRFKRYIIANAAMNLFLAYPANKIFQKLNVYKLVNFKSIHVFLTYIGYAVIIYGYQLLLDQANSKSVFIRKLFT
ncbi:hypothetical protein [Bacillus sp. Marseille-P3661]|uniref:hypothetical protein n=1 Tax=Bacillus sp. Marseille-P3661 TaxID=1936234 RepID=UPI000C8285B3|nr:hypothetical protein [Bacillus sp. Marseille-P3661]